MTIAYHSRMEVDPGADSTTTIKVMADESDVICRLCARVVIDESCEKMYENGIETALTVKLKKVLGLDVSADDGCPDVVCPHCAGIVDIFCRFAARAKKADGMFKKGENPGGTLSLTS